MKNRTMRGISAVLAVLGLGACAYDTAERTARLQVFVGQPVTLLVSQMGVPARTYETGGVQFLAYIDRRVDYLPGVPAYGPGFGMPYGPYGYGAIGGMPPQV